jgi:ribosomal protein S18 acetylase RimI-like enzyme
MIRLESKSSPDLKTWMAGMLSSYYQDLLDSGFTHRDAQRNLARNKESLFDGDDLVEGHFVFNAVDDDTVVGVIWIADKLDPVAKDWYVYDIEVDKKFRGQGYGRLTMQAAEQYVTSHGGRRLGLNVAGPNTVARGLYESMEYKIMSVGMYKDFE